MTGPRSSGRARTTSASRRSRDPERSRTAILDAAEALFARQGFEGTSIAAIADEAGVSVGLPGYFFGSKEQLHRDVLQRVLAHRDSVLNTIMTEAEELLDGASSSVAAIRHVIWGYIEFLLDHPNFVWLLTRDALEHANTREESPRHSLVFAERLTKLMSRAGCQVADEDPDQFFLSLIGMCYFPLEHDATVVAGMGQRAWSRAFQTRRVDHIVNLLVPNCDEQATT